MMNTEFTFNTKSIFFDENYQPSDNTRLTTNFANLARGSSRQENLRNTLKMIDNRFNSLADWDNPMGDRYAVELEIIRLSARYAPQFATAVATRVADTGDAEQVRAANAWLCWFGARQGDPRAAPALAHLLASVEGDVTEFGPLPGWVLL